MMNDLQVACLIHLAIGEVEMKRNQVCYVWQRFVSKALEDALDVCFVPVSSIHWAIFHFFAVGNSSVTFIKAKSVGCCICILFFSPSSLHCEVQLDLTR